MHWQSFLSIMKSKVTWSWTDGSNLRKILSPLHLFVLMTKKFVLIPYYGHTENTSVDVRSHLFWILLVITLSPEQTHSAITNWNYTLHLPVLFSFRVCSCSVHRRGTVIHQSSISVWNQSCCPHRWLHLNRPFRETTHTHLKMSYIQNIEKFYNISDICTGHVIYVNMPHQP